MRQTTKVELLEVHDREASPTPRRLDARRGRPRPPAPVRRSIIRPLCYTRGPNLPSEHGMKSFRVVLAAPWVLVAFALGGAQILPPPAGNEAGAFNKAMHAPDPETRATALAQFIKDYPSGPNTRRAYQALFSLTLPTSTEKAIEYAEKALATTPETEKPGYLNNFASSLADKETALERAYDYSRRSVEIARKQGSSARTLSTYLDTLAYLE